MPRKGTFYLGRIHKGGRLTHDHLVTAFAEPQRVHHRDYAWTFINYESDPEGTWHFAQLAKYRPEGTVTVVDHERHAERERIEPDLIAAVSPFVYLPEFSGIVYLHVWNHIQRETFRKRFADIILESMDQFFASCEIEPISDIRTFIKRIAALRRIDKISAKVHLPNPLFGPLWKSLSDYVADRNAESVKLEEHARGEGLATDLPSLVSANAALVDKPVAIGDAAILMAADGYGSGRVVGRSEQATVVVKTSESQVNFRQDRESPAVELASRAFEAFAAHSSDRLLLHKD